MNTFTVLALAMCVAVISGARDHCDPNPCQNGGSCVMGHPPDGHHPDHGNHGGEHHCVCLPGFHGGHCQEMDATTAAPGATTAVPVASTAAPSGAPASSAAPASTAAPSGAPASSAAPASTAAPSGAPASPPS